MTRGIEANDEDACSDEAVGLRHGLALLAAVYNELDSANCRLAVATSHAKM